ncbi:MAG: ArdC-like ssDNA-binding domain-containing protein [Bryobacteraceae bacterium]
MTTDKARSLTEQIEASVNQLATETDETRQSELFKNWLNAMAQFGSYSWNNQLLIAFQRSASSTGQVAAFHAWRKLGRHVKKGAKGIAILAPCVYRKKADDDEEDSPTSKSVRGFRTVYVFCEEDTDGQPLPRLTYGAESGGDELLSRLEWVTEEEVNIILDYEEIKEPGVEGYSAGGRIVIRTSLSPTAKAGVEVHELAHELLHKRDKQPNATKTSQQRELEAEAIAYVVMRHFGIEHVACNYLATYKIDGTQLKESLQTISTTAKFLIAAIDPMPRGRSKNCTTG